MNCSGPVVRIAANVYVITYITITPRQPYKMFTGGHCVPASEDLDHHHMWRFTTSLDRDGATLANVLALGLHGQHQALQLALLESGEHGCDCLLGLIIKLKLKIIINF